jgi:RNA polymerase sigma-70 factor (ECF subfamily)
MLFSHPLPLHQATEFARFYETAHLSVFRYVMVLCAGDQPEAEDITAEAFFRAWEKRLQFSGSPSAALGWVITIARNILIDRRRAENAHPGETALDEALAGGESSVESILIDEDQLQQVLAAVSGLPLPQRDIFTLRYVLGWRVNAIAAHLGLAENTVSASLRRALAKLQDQLVPQDLAPGRSL